MLFVVFSPRLSLYLHTRIQHLVACVCVLSVCALMDSGGGSLGSDAR